MNLKDILAELGKQIGLDDVKLDENGLCRLVFDKNYIVDIEEAEDKKTVHIYSPICIIPTEGKEALYATILEANLFGQGTGGATFAIDQNLNEVLLFRTLDIEKTDYQDFANELEEFVGWVATWMEKIKAQDFQQPIQDSDESMAHQGFLKG